MKLNRDNTNATQDNENKMQITMRLSNFKNFKLTALMLMIT